MFEQNAQTDRKSTRPRTDKLVGVASAAMLSVGMLTACGDTAEETAPTTATVTMETTEAAPEESSSTSSATSAQAVTSTATITQGAETTPADDGQAPGSDEERRVALQNDVSEQLKGQNGVGGTIVFDGVPSEICIYGDSHALNLVTAGPNTSCEFAANVFREATASIDASQNVRDLLPLNVVAESPTTGGTYEMQCSNDPRNLITCTGGKDATVYMY